MVSRVREGRVVARRGEGARARGAARAADDHGEVRRAGEASSAISP